MNKRELQTWDELHRYPHMTRSPEGRNHRWNPEKHPGDKIGGVILEDRIDPKTRKRMLVLAVPRRTRHVTVWVSYTHLISLIEEAEPAVGERIGITFIGPGEFREPTYSISLPDRPVDANSNESTEDQIEGP